jgi:integrase
LERDIFPWIGGVSVTEITTPVVLGLLRRIEAKGYGEVAFRVKISISQVMRFAIAAGKAEIDPCPSLRGILAPRQQKHMAAITKPVEVGELLRAIDQIPGSDIVRAAQLDFTLPVALRLLDALPLPTIARPPLTR